MCYKLVFFFLFFFFVSYNCNLFNTFVSLYICLGLNYHTFNFILSFTRYTDGMFQSIFPFKDNKYSLCYLIVLTKSQKENMKCFSGHLLKNLCKTSHCAHILICLVEQLKIGQLLANTTESLPTVFTDLTVVM